MFVKEISAVQIVAKRKRCLERIFVTHEFHLGGFIVLGAYPTSGCTITARSPASRIMREVLDELHSVRFTHIYLSHTSQSTV